MQLQTSVQKGNGGSLLFPKSFFPLTECGDNGELPWTMWMNTKIKGTRDLDDSA